MGTGRVGELGVEIVTLENDASDTAEALSEDTKFVADLEKNCAEKTGIHEEEKKVRGAEVDALELFKKTLPGASSSFLQLKSGEARAQARAILSGALSKATDRHNLDFILLALRGKKVAFDKITKLIDQMVVTLKKEQGDDEYKKEFCA